MDLKKLNVVIVAALAFLGLCVLAGSSLALTNASACQDAQPTDPTPGCQYERLQHMLLVVAGLSALAVGPIGLLTSPFLYIGPAVLAGASVIVDMVFMLRYRTDSLWQFQTESNKKLVLSQQLHYFGESGALFILSFFLFFFTRFRRAQLKDELEEAQQPETISANLGILRRSLAMWMSTVRVSISR